MSLMEPFNQDVDACLKPQATVLERKASPPESSSRKERYQAYINSTAWALRKAEFYAGRVRKCAKCDWTDNLHVHHITYERLGAELDEDLMILCRKCHKAVHKRTRRMSLKRATEEYIPHRGRHKPGRPGRKARRNGVVGSQDSTSWAYRCRKKCGWKGSDPKHEWKDAQLGAYCPRCSRWLKWVPQVEFAGRLDIPPKPGCHPSLT